MTGDGRILQRQKMNTHYDDVDIGYVPHRYVRTPEAARFLGLSGRTLEKHRTYGTGPRYSKLGGRVVYRMADLQSWADLGSKASTSDPGNGTISPAKRGEGQRSPRITSRR
jgi:predicted DNA-binding transcriptional regulator AlpA